MMVRNILDVYLVLILLTITADIIRSLSFPQMWDRRDRIEPCYPNTCQWILGLDKYTSWRDQSRGLLWIKGRPGAGKSTLMAFLHEELRKSPDASQGIGLEFFFYRARHRAAAHPLRNVSVVAGPNLEIEYYRTL